MIGAATRYRELLTQLLMHRELAGGTLPEEVESQFVEELDRCWWALTPQEQGDIEQALGDETPPTASVDLRLADKAIAPGSHGLPREQAA